MGNICSSRLPADPKMPRENQAMPTHHTYHPLGVMHKYRDSLPCSRAATNITTQTSGEYSRVHEGSHAEVRQNEEEDDAIIERHCSGDGLGQPGTPGEIHGERKIK